jgi:GntR family transcriptional repressor for pyruvate dehydrogenase complex
VQATHLRERAVAQIRDRIERGALKVGDRLPSERELTVLLGVSRTVVREAIRALESVGIIEVRHGRGAFVRRSMAWSPLWAGWRLAHASRLTQLYQVREAMEAKAAELASEHATPDDIVRLRRALQDFRTVAKADLDAVVTADTAFHSHLARASGNIFLVEAVESLHEALADDRRAIFAINHRAEKSCREHERIVVAVERRSPAAARRAVRRHFRNVVADLQRAVAADVSARGPHAAAGLRNGQS